MGVDLIYRFLLARPIDDEGRQHYLSRIRDEGATLRQVAAEIASSDEFQRRLRDSTPTDITNDHRARKADTFVDVRELSQSLTVEELARTAEDYYRTTVEFTNRYLAKPFDELQDVPELLGSFAHVLGGLRLARGMTVLDFGAGVCWTTRALTQLGCATVALDVSPTALAIGKQRYELQPVIGELPPPRFLVFDGHRIELPDASVDRIICFDAFHHVPNPGEVIREFARVLRPGGIAGFSEPGPSHSRAARSQYEMKNYVAFENDIVLEDIWAWAQDAGFSHIEVALFNTESNRVPLREFNEIIAGRESHAYARSLRSFLSEHRTFFLIKGEATKDSRHRDGLRAELAIRLAASELSADQRICGTATIQNVGTAHWLPGTVSIGGVNLGVHLRSSDGRPLSVDFARVILEHSTGPGDIRNIPFDIPAPAAGAYLLEFDMVSEGVGWFELNDSPTVTVRLTVV